MADRRNLLKLDGYKIHQNIHQKARFVQISFLKNGNLDSKKHLKGPFPNPKAQNRHK
jgi:hypothetical protein